MNLSSTLPPLASLTNAPANICTWKSIGLNKLFESSGSNTYGETSIRRETLIVIVSFDGGHGGLIWPETRGKCRSLAVTRLDLTDHDGGMRQTSECLRCHTQPGGWGPLGEKRKGEEDGRRQSSQVAIDFDDGSGANIRFRKYPLQIRSGPPVKNQCDAVNNILC